MRSAAELIDVEEPAVIDLLGRYTPVCEPVRLLIEQLISDDRSCAAGRRRPFMCRTLTSISARTSALAVVSAGEPAFAISFRGLVAMSSASRELRDGRFRLDVTMLCSSSASGPAWSANHVSR